jgi:hypothetical protein
MNSSGIDEPEDQLDSPEAGREAVHGASATHAAHADMSHVTHCGGGDGGGLGGGRDCRQMQLMQEQKVTDAVSNQK